VLKGERPGQFHGRRRRGLQFATPSAEFLPWVVTSVSTRTGQQQPRRGNVLITEPCPRGFQLLPAGQTVRLRVKELLSPVRESLLVASFQGVPTVSKEGECWAQNRAPSSIFFLQVRHCSSGSGFRLHFFLGTSRLTRFTDGSRHHSNSSPVGSSGSHRMAALLSLRGFRASPSSHSW